MAIQTLTDSTPPQGGITNRHNHPLTMSGQKLLLVLIGASVAVAPALRGHFDPGSAAGWGYFTGAMLASIGLCMGGGALLGVIAWYLVHKSPALVNVSFAIGVSLIIVLSAIGRTQRINAASSPTAPSTVQVTPALNAMPSPALNDLTTRVNKLELLLSSQKLDLTSLDSRVFSSEMILESLGDSLDERQHPRIDPTRPTYVTVDSGSGMLIVSCRSVERYLSGCRIAFQIGNPYAMTFREGIIHITHGRREPVMDLSKKADSTTLSKWSDDHTAWKNGLRTEEFTFPNDLPPGSWSDIVVTLANTRAEELEYMTISISTSTVMLHEARGR